MDSKLKKMLEDARVASRKLNLATDGEINKVLLAVADAIESHLDEMLVANVEDLNAMDQSDPKYDRLRLTEDRLTGIASDMRRVAELPSPLGTVLKDWTQPNGMEIKKISVPFGVIGVIYEARPNVTFDVFSLCLKSGNVCVLKGGSDALHSNEAAIKIIRNTLKECGFDENCATLLPADHEATKEVLQAVGYVDLVIPRGSSRLIQMVRDNALVPVIETGAGICHCYFHSSADLEKGKAIVCNAKTRRVSVCNALDCLIIDKDRLGDLEELLAPMVEKQVEVYADAAAFNALDGKYPLLHRATEDNFGMEYLDYKMTVVTVSGIDEALAHIAKYSSKHSESIVAEDKSACLRFEKEVDAACVYTNLPTSFTDGGQFGFGAEIGISTQKLHARGPMGLPELTTYKYLISGNGQIRNS
jgi:glutamate-5-semialdehyde dehydrogenase